MRDAEQTEMTISEYDLAVFKAAEVEKERKHERVLTRWRNGALAVGYLSAAAVIIGAMVMLWVAQRGPSATEEIDAQQRTACTQAHGTWVKIVDGSAGGQGTCIFGSAQE